MQAFEYKVIPAPNKGKKAKGVKTPEDRFANGVEAILNEMAVEGWEFQRAEMLPSEERSGLTGSKTNWRNLLVFRRALHTAAPAEAPAAPSETVPSVAAAASATATARAAAEAAPPVAAAPATPSPAPEPPLTAIAGDPEAPPEAVAIPGAGARKMISDDGVEELSPVSGLTAALKQRAGLKNPLKEPEDG
ncbi:hypothetical protein TRM7557_02834 [Tritonibacter multivorans]|uniref:DUF4177 domain-containing protein n=1 Tax=Tritonibacter multivorans TaxID=928856 RepID=A0A0P1GF67_9RHOB|nr:hypothetical protein [Tritonibacter multivorans]MDA7421028.1 DUF4177 domain-containing protein [Tritonibacter multivorans]CUH80320.1 hypothetical protein TRM7557_02834 [Tritonibacter multivorans]SFC77989.1 hypothetical protein SAMN04488049_104117 [Tritonibacter multivorans]